jgi:hypothetical protein
MKTGFKTLILFLLVLNQAVAQDQCGSSRLMESIKSDPALWSVYKSRFVNKSDGKNHPNVLQSVVTIPVVVHVVKNNANMNVLDADIQTMIDILNQDFAKQNPDTTQIPVAFQPLAGSVPIQFCMAQRDPYGFPTNGIVRVTSTHAPFGTSLLDIVEITSTSTGGSDIWPTSMYYDIYITDLITGIAGLAFSIGNGPILIDYVSVTSRTVSHEAGHSFGLEHIWGQTDGTVHTCADDDGIADTPLQWGPKGGSYPTYDSCTTSGDGIMTFNYMNYSPLRYFFSIGQCTQMLSTFNQNYIDLTFANGCIPLAADDAGCSAVLSPNGSSCNSFTPVVELRNFGLSNLTSAIISYQIDAGNINTYTWNGTLATQDTAYVTLPSVTAGSGTHTFTTYSTMPNGTLDPDNSNDTTIVSFEVVTPLNLPIAESFENAFPPSGWVINNPDGDSTFNQTSLGSFGGDYSCIHNAQNSVYASYDELSTSLDLSLVSQAAMTFWRAYSYNQFQGYSDTLEVWVSSDCGTTFSLLYRRYDSTLVTAPLITGQLFIPTQISYWNIDTVDLSAYAFQNPVIVKFKVINPWGKQLYIDNININGIWMGTSLPGSDLTFSIYPNPTSDFFTVNLHSSFGTQADLEISNMLGEVVFQKHLTSSHESIYTNLSKGIYLIKVRSDAGSVVKKLIKE